MGWLVLKLMLLARRGFPDLLALKDGRAVFIECKRLGGKPTELQEHRHRQLRKLGFDVVVIDDESKISVAWE